MFKKLFSHTVIYGFAPQVAKVAQFFILPVITQDLTEIDFGVAGILTAYTSSIAVLAFLGLRVILVNTFYKSPNHFKWAWRQIYGFLTLWNFVYALLLGFLIYWIIPEEAHEDRWLIMLINVAPLVLFGPVGTIGTTYFQLKQKPLQIGLRTALFGVLAVFLNLYFISFLKLGYMGWFWSNLIVTVLSNASYYYPINFKFGLKPIFNFKWRLIKQSLKVSLPTVPHYYSTYLLNSSDKMVMDVLGVGVDKIGKYNAAYMVGNIFQQIGVAAGFAVGPMMMQKFKEGKDIVARNLIFGLQFAFFVLTFLASIWLKELFSFLLRSPGLDQLYSLGIIIIMGYNYRPMYMGSSNKLFFVEKTNIIWKVTFVAGIINVVLNSIFIPIYGFEVAAYTTFISLMFMGYIGFFIPSIKAENPVNYHPLAWLIMTIGLTVGAYFIVDFPMHLKIVITLLVLGISLISAFLFKKRFN
ncbi:lipopolysaccharide biosynthesis protein [Algoriphagus sp. D3-2-R+10]|uniref:lipopolysaccharide biosynthesis protein n=1 Tax=Algoriphagus aurantiacus TaxID=3103948 RepID=UPI002B3AA42E|nr:lipopolysaccharide biosynthesis protein [Algoriphagus sp. D3-2-R+10]MEB2777500.1 lipopolysaccharide biosynthesis protein [Algoriphagus sp. D3-2-R+10]